MVQDGYLLLHRLFIIIVGIPKASFESVVRSVRGCRNVVAGLGGVGRCRRITLRTAIPLELLQHRRHRARLVTPPSPPV